MNTHDAKWKEAAARLNGKRPTIHTICAETKTRLPFSREEMRALKIQCETWGIVPNISDAPCWRDIK